MKTEEMGRELGRKLNGGIRLRSKAEYEPHAAINKEDAEHY